MKSKKTRSSATTRWVELPGSNKTKSPGSHIGEAIAQNQELRVLVRLRRARPLPLPSKAAAGRKYLTRDEYARQHGAKAQDIERVAAFAKRFGLSVDAVFPVERSLFLTGTVREFSKAFQVELKSHRLASGRSYRGREGIISIPRELKGIVVGVFGLDDRPAVKRHVRFRPPSGDAARHGAGSFQTPGEINPFFGNQLAALYNFPPGTDGGGQTIGIVEIGGGFKQADLDKYFHAAGVANPPSFAVATVPGGGANAPAPNDPELPDVEVLLDMEVAGSAAPGANFVMYFGQDGSTQQTLLAVQAAVHDRGAEPTVLSLSWGGEEYDSSLGGGGQGVLEQQYQDNMNDLFQTAASLGVTVCVSSGDDGSACAPLNDPRQPWDHHAHVSFPASSSYVLAVGGTHIISAKVGAMEEETWHPGPNEGTGGGISRYFLRPTYQQKAVNLKAVNPPAGIGRGVPDVAGDAAQESGYVVYVDGETYPSAGSNPPVGGTSASTPLWAALIARINQALETNVGFVNPSLYALPASASAFRDITKGNNGDYKAAPGWDPCTGFGVPEGQALLNALSAAVRPQQSSLIARRVAASKRRQPPRPRGPIERPTAEQISGEVSRRISEFDSDNPRTYFAGAIESAAINTARTLAPIQWPRGKNPVPAPLAVAPDPNAPLTATDYLVVTWTVEEAKALADVLTPGYASKTAWYHYTHNFTSKFVPLIQPGAPAVKDSHRLGSYYRTTIAGKATLCFKSELHLNQDGPKLPILKLWEQLIAEVNPKVVITTGTGGGIGSFVQLGDVVVAPSVRFDCTQKFKSEPFAKSVYATSALSRASMPVAAKLFAANAGQLPQAARLPTIITEPAPGVLSADIVTTDFFAYDDVLGRYGLQGLGSACDEGDAALGLVIQRLASPTLKWAAVRNASDPQIQDQGMTSKQGYELATSYYGRYGYWTSICSAITCWALILDN